jgi:tRNA(fMet)-specific endonuclease VapC
VAKSAFPARNREALEAFTLPLEVVPFDTAAALAYGAIRATLERQGTPIGAMDLLIAAHARSLGITLVTNNPREFRRVEGLQSETWG